MSKAMTFIRAAHEGAGRWRRQATGGAVRDAIEHHMRFAPGDVMACGRLYSWYDGQPLSLYGLAIKQGNDSFTRAYEQDLGFEPWRWPGCLVSGHGTKDPFERLYVGRDLWYVRNGEMRIWQVTSMSADSLTCVLHRDREEPVPCETCHHREHQYGNPKMEAKVTFTRERFAVLTGRLAGYAKAGILEVDGVVAWELVPVTEGLSADERAWRGTLLAGKNHKQYGHGQVWQDVVVLQGRGITIHGTSVRGARGLRKERLRRFEAAFREGYGTGYYYDGLRLGLDDPIPVRLLPRGRSDKIPRLAQKLRGRETVTARELLQDAPEVTQAVLELKYMVRHMGRAVREAVSAAERKSREEAERAALLARLQDHRDVRVMLADSFAVGNCAPGTVAWLTEHFPEALRGVRLDLPAERLQRHLARLKRYLTVGDLLENPKVLDHYYARLAIQHAIEREAGKSVKGV
jgi:hypothetical protein